MGEKVKVEIFGIMDQAPGGGCSCSGPCEPQQTMGEMYEKLVEFIKNSNVNDKVDVKFIDIINDCIEGYDSVKKALENGYRMPLTAVNGTNFQYF